MQEKLSGIDAGSGGASSIALTNAIANEGTPKIESTNGQIRVGDEAGVYEWSLF